jgi:2-(1,2-epoxy-1,2-dihydrophenyl)acetyl-CoA isomerase
MTDPLLVDLADGVLRLTLNRPEKLNALTWELMRRLYEELHRAAVDPAVRVVVLAGSGRGFCGGGDLRGPVDEADPIAQTWASDPIWNSIEQKALQVRRYNDASLLLHTMPKPTIAMVRGATAGAGLCLAAACDFRIVSENAFFTTVFVKSGRSGDYGGSYLLHHLVGPAKARELYLLGDRIDAQEALRIGLVTRVVADGDLENETVTFAARLAAGPPVAYHYIKRNLHAAETQTLAQILELESYHMMRTSATEDAREAVRADREKRAPSYKAL